jgi:serine/threonine-protein kinase HipA
VLHNERLFMTAATNAGLKAPAVEVVEDRDGVRALAVTRFDRSWHDGQLVRHAQEDASQVLGLRPSQKYDPDARTVIARCRSCAPRRGGRPRPAASDALQLRGR